MNTRLVLLLLLLLAAAGGAGAQEDASTLPTSSPTLSPIQTVAPSTATTTLPHTLAPVSSPTSSPTVGPSTSPTVSPTALPTASPTLSPTRSPTPPTTFSPTMYPTMYPTRSPTPPTTRRPTKSPTTSRPTNAPTTSHPTQSPTVRPTKSPTTSRPTKSPTTSLPSKSPTRRPTRMPTTRQPTKLPTTLPTKLPTLMPTKLPTKLPTTLPSQGPTLSPSARPTALPSPAPSMSPSAAPTLRLPRVTNATINSAATHITVLFDRPTNQVGAAARKACSYYVALADVVDTGCSNGTACELHCFWPSSDKLVIELNSKSTYTQLPSLLNITQAGNIRHTSGALPNLAFVLVPVAAPPMDAPQVVITGPKSVFLCGKPAQLVAAFSRGAGGRPVVFAWTANGQPLQNNASVLAAAKPASATTVVYGVTTTNWFGLTSSAALAEFAVKYEESAGVQVVLSGAPADNFTVSATGRITVQSTVSFPTECIPANKSARDIQFTYKWTITALDAGGSVAAQQPLTSSTLKLSPASLLVPGHAYRLRLEVDSGLNVTGQAETTVTVLRAPVVAALATPTSFSVDPASSSSSSAGMVVISAARSCDPNEPSPLCDVSAGASNASHALLAFAWTCRMANGTDCSTALCATTAASCVFPAAQLAHDASPYTFYATVMSISTGSMEPPSRTPDVVVTVLAPLPPACVRPTVTMLPFPAKINVGDSGEAPLRALVVAGGSSAAIALKWELVSGGELLLPATAFASSANQANLVLQLSKLSPGSEYTFRLTAVLACTLGHDSFGEVSFKTNTAPVGGSLASSALRGQAASTQFQFTANGFADEDLPLEYLFEYTTDGGASYVPMSSFQPSSVLTTTFPAGENIKVVVRCRDALGAVTARDQSPAIEGISVSALVLSAGVLPPAPSDTLQNLLAEGGSQEDALRFASSLAASTQSVDLANADPAVRDWLLQAQDTLLDLVSGTRAGGAAAPEPSAVLMQSSALASILHGSSGLQDASSPTGAQFLSKAAGLVGQLVDDAKLAVRGKSSSSSSSSEAAENDEDEDPLMSQYVPADLGAITLSSLESILSAISSSSSALQPGQRRRQLSSSTVAANENSVAQARSTLRQLVDVLLLGAVPGSQPKLLPGTDLSLACVRQTPASIGNTDSGFTELSVPALLTGGGDAAPIVFRLPENVLGNTAGASAKQIIIHSVRYRHNIRELVSRATQQYNYTLDSNAPVGGNVTGGMVSLDFFESAQTGLLHPVELVAPIEINFTLRWEDLPSNSSLTKLACGYWDETSKGWSSSGCNLTSYSFPASPTELGWQVCACNHASDYSVWQAFVDDLGHVFVDIDLTTLTLVSSLVIGLLVPVLFAFWLTGACASRKKDTTDRAMVHLGTFVSITKRKLELNARKRRVFRLLRDNQHHCKGGNTIISVKQLLADVKRDRSVQLHGEDAAHLIELQARQDYFDALFRLAMKLLAALTLAVGTMLLSSITAPTFMNQQQQEMMGNPAVSGDVLGLTIAAGVVQVGTAAVCLLWAWRIQQRHQLVGWLASLQFLVAVPCSLAAMGLAVEAANRDAAARRVSMTVDTGLGLLIAGASLTVLSSLLATAAYGFQHSRGAGVWRHFVDNVGKGMVYEQSLLSLVSRYDPYFDRIQRVSIVLGVVVGNLFAESFFFSLKESDDVSVGMMIGTILLAALVVAIPVKLLLRALFRATASRTASPEDRVAQIFRVIAFSNDVTPGGAHKAAQMDTLMLNQLRRFYTAEMRVGLIENALHHQDALEEDRQRLERGLPPKYSHEHLLPIVLAGSAVVWLAVAGLLIAVEVNSSSGGVAGAGAACALAACVLMGLVSNVERVRQRAYWVFRALVAVNLASGALTWAANGLVVDEQAAAAAASALAIVALGLFAYAAFVYFRRNPASLQIERFPRDSRGTTLAMRQEEQLTERHQSQRVPVVSSSVRDASSSLIAAREQQQVVLKKTSELVSDNPMNFAAAATSSSPKTPPQLSLAAPDEVRRQRLDVQLANHSSRFERHVKDSAQLKQNSVLGAVLDEDGLATHYALQQARGERAQAAESLKQVIKQSRAAWGEINPLNMSAKQLAVRSEKSMLLKFATVLAEEPAKRPRIVRQLFPPGFIYCSWLLLAVYYVAGLVWVAFWVLTRDQTSVRLLEASLGHVPTREEVSHETNSILAAWLWASFLGVFVGYFVAEPVVIVLRYGFFPAVLEMSRPEEVEMTTKEWIAHEIIEAEKKEKEGEEKAEEEVSKKQRSKLKANHVMAAALDMTCEAVETLA